MANLVASFGKDYFILDSSTCPEFIVSSGYEDCVTVNGMSLSRIIGIDGSVFVPDTEIMSGTGNGYTAVNIKNAFSDGNGTLYQATNGNYLYNVHIDSSTPFEFAIGQMNQDETRTDSSYVTISYDPGTTSEQKYTKVKKMIDNNTSYELLRANPKLTGNVKVVVDSKSDIYLDTFKVSKGLSQRKYRKIKLNPDDYYGTALMSKMSSLTSDDFYKIEDTCYSMFSLANNLGEQYYDKYNSGARTNSDRMYTENFSILAPLCIKKTMPDFFLVFKIKDYRDITDYTERLKYFLKNGTLVKAFDLRKDSNAGKLMRNVYEKSKDFVGDLYVSYNYDLDNVYNGISIDRGVMSSIHESASLERYIKNQVAMNDWYTLGFERNRIVSKNIINFEFMFDDTEENLFSVNTYFGLYVRLNGEDSDFSCTGTLQDRTPVFDSEISGTGFVPDAEQNLDIIYGMSTADGFKRLRTNIASKASYSILQEYMKRPYKNIASPELIKMSDDIYGKSFASITVNTVMDVGEHYRIVDFQNNRIYEVVLSNYKDDEFDISEANHYEKTMMDSSFSIERVTVYGVGYRQIEVTGSADHMELVRKKEIRLVTEAFNSFGEDVVKAYPSDDSFTIVYNGRADDSSIGTVIEKVSSFFAVTDEEKATEPYYEDDSTSFFGEQTSDMIVLHNTDTGMKEVLYPSGFEALGDRICRCYSFVPFDGNDKRMYLLGESVEIELSKEKSIIFDTSTGYSTARKFSIHAVKDDFTLDEKQVWDVPGLGDGTRLIGLESEPDSTNGRMHFFNMYPLNVGICSIFPVRDIMTDVLDYNNKIATADEHITSNRGEFNTSSNVFGKNILDGNGSEESVMNYFDKSEKFSVLNGILNEKSRTAYLTKMNTADHKYSDLPMLCPCCCKWKLTGSDARGESMRVMYKYETYLENNSYFIPSDDDAYIGSVTVSDGNEVGIGESTYGPFDSSMNGFPKYINSNLDPRTHHSFRDFLFNGNGSIDDIIHNEANGSNAIMSFAYSNGKDSIEFIGGGLKIRIHSNNTGIIDISRYNGYSALLMCCSGNNPARLNPCEILIDEINEQISVIVYNGSAPWQMFYNASNAKRTVDGSVRIPVVYPVMHTSSMKSCEENISDYGTAFTINDDSSLTRGNVQLVDSSDGLVVLSSPVVDHESFMREKEVTVIGRVYNDRSLGSSGKISIFDSSLIIDSSVVEEGTSKYITLQNQPDKRSECADMFIVSDLPSSVYTSENDTYNIHDEVYSGKVTDYATLPLSIVKGLLEKATMSVKTVDGTSEYSSSNGIFTISTVDPVDVVREDSEFTKLNESNPLRVHPSYSEPVTNDILSFGYSNVETNEMFGKSFDGCNIRIGGISALNQIWIKKFSTKPLVSNEMKTEVEEITTHTVRFYVNKNTVSSQNIRTDIVEDSSLTDSSGNTYTVKDLSYLDKTASEITLKLSTNGPGYYIDSSANRYELQFYTNETWGDITSCSIVKISDSSTSGYTSEEGTTYYKYTELEITAQIYPQPEILKKGFKVWLREKDTKKHFYFTIKDDEIKYSYKIYGRFYANINDLANDELPSTGITVTFVDKNNSSIFNAKVEAITSESEEQKITGNIAATTGFSVYNDLFPISDCWNTNIYRTFTDLDDFSAGTGIDSGYEKNMFFASHGINMKSIDEDGDTVDYIDITEWKGTVIDNIKKTMVLDITESVINKIMYTKGYMSNWRSMKGVKPADKRRYIENSIMPFINIDDKCQFEMYESPSGSIGEITIRTGMFTESETYRKIQNMTNTLYKANDKYYMKIEGLDAYEYAAKMRIRL